MKKWLIIILLFICGCSDKYMVCNLKIDNEKQNYKMEGIYTIYYRNGFVLNVKEEEKYQSNEQSVIDYYDNYLHMQGLNFQKLYGGITYQVNVNGSTIMYTSEIDFNRIDKKGLIHNHYIDYEYVKKDRITLTGIQNRYEQKGATCK